MVRSKAFAVLLFVFIFYGCGASTPKDVSPVMAKVGGCEISVAEFESGFATSAFSVEPDQVQARRDYLQTLIDQKLILLDAQAKGLDKTPDFINSIERFWSQSLLTLALGQKTIELRKGLKVRDEDVREIYAGMVKDGVTTKPLEEIYPQLVWQAERSAEALRFNAWMAELRRKMVISIDERSLNILK